MLHELETVIFIEYGNEYEGVILGCERDYFWLLVHDQRCVDVGHPDRVFELGGKKYFEIFDHCRAVEKLFNASGKADSYIFSYSKTPERIIELLMVYKLLGVA